MSSKRVMFVVHVGKTVGHLVRALAVADELAARDCRPEFVASDRAVGLLDAWPTRYAHHRVPWNWSHNDAEVPRPGAGYTSRVTETADGLLSILRAARPKLVVGFPGVFSTQAARALEVRHASVLHAPYVWPIVELNAPQPAEEAVQALAARVTHGAFTSLMQALSRDLGLPPLTYEAYLATETIFIPQPGLPLRRRYGNLAEFGFIRASYGGGRVPAGLDLAGTCHVTFGSGNPCDLGEVVAAVRTVFPQVLVTGWPGRAGEVQPGVFACEAIPSRSLAGRVAAVVSHGGIGTVGTFAEHGTPQLVIPTEIDQATMAIHATRAGIAREYGLDAWARDPRLGRRLPPIDRRALVDRLEEACAAPPPARIPSDGAAEIAANILQLLAGSTSNAGRSAITVG